MANSEENINKDKNENRNINIEQNSPEILTNPIYTPAFLREQIGRLMRVEFLIGTNNMVLRSFENDSLVYCDIYSIKFITISTTGFYGSINNMNSMNNMGTPNRFNYF